MIIVDQIESRFKIFTRPQHMHWMTTLKQCLLNVRRLELAKTNVMFIIVRPLKKYFSMSPLDCININPWA